MQCPAVSMYGLKLLSRVATSDAEHRKVPCSEPCVSSNCICATDLLKGCHSGKQFTSCSQEAALSGSGSGAASSAICCQARSGWNSWCATRCMWNGGGPVMVVPSDSNSIVTDGPVTVPLQNSPLA